MGDMILVAVGANLASEGRTPLATCRWAVDQVASLPGLRLCSVSRWFATRPIPASDQPSFVNGVIRLAGTAIPLDLLRSLHRIEAAAGRVRGAANAARTLDLDLLAVDGQVIATPALTLPHPRMQDRAFVMLPLHDVAPDWRHPVLGVTAMSLLEGVAGQEIEAL